MEEGWRRLDSIFLFTLHCRNDGTTGNQQKTNEKQEFFKTKKSYRKRKEGRKNCVLKGPLFCIPTAWVGSLCASGCVVCVTVCVCVYWARLVDNTKWERSCIAMAHTNVIPTERKLSQVE